jgi:8-oxo-dGTP pyrophosphatase MutT (NUDIX family)
MAEVALAILTVGDGYALQHRDDIPTIAAAGHWALFGGTVSEGEAPAAAIRREIREELALDVTWWRLLWPIQIYVPFRDAVIRHWIFAADVTAEWSRHVLGEGQGCGVFTIDALPRPMETIVTALLERYHATARPA